MFLCVLKTSLWTSPEGGEEKEGLQSRPTPPAPIMQAEKNEVFLFFFGASLLNAQRSPDFGQRKWIILYNLEHHFGLYISDGWLPKLV
jgi:hypothetical protein